MPNTDAFALRRSGFDDFLYAPVGTEANGTTLSLLSVFARAGDDPWVEAGRLAGLPKSEATESVARSIAGMPTSQWPLQAATTIADRLIALLPSRASIAAQSAPAPAPAAGAKGGGRLFRMTVVVACVVGMLAFEAGLFTASAPPTLGGNTMPGFTAAPGSPPGGLHAGPSRAGSR
jgi:hypothetical protein